MGIMDKLNYYSQFTDKDIFKPGAFNPGLFEANKKKIKNLRPEACSFINLLAGNRFNTPSYMQVQMNDGDIQPAVVISTEPLLVACYTDDFDAVILQCYPTELGRKYGWDLHKRLITVNTYNGLGAVRKNKDIYPGQKSSGKYKSVGPVIADLYTDNKERIERKKNEIPEEYWQKTLELGNEYMVKHPGMARNGLGFCFKDAKKISEIKFSPRIKLDK